MQTHDHVRDFSRHLVKVEQGPGDEQDPGVRDAWPLRRRLRVGMTIVLFVVPVLASILYNFVIATPRYASETSFVVRTGSQSSNRFSLPGIIQTPGQDDSEAIVSFIESRSLLSAIDRDGSARAIFAARGVDMFNRFPSLFASSNNESFYRHFGKYVRADFDRATSITTVEVQAFSAKDAHDLARRIVSESEGLVICPTRCARSVGSSQRCAESPEPPS